MTGPLAQTLFGVCVALAVWLAAWGLSFRVHVPTTGRNVAIDGLRGLMALGVFVYHSDIWFEFIKTGQWGPPPSSLYRHLGDTCVKVFFMITSYLFVGKILDNRQRPIDWRRLFISRILRLTPLYLFAVAVLLLMNGALTRWTLYEPLDNYAANVIQWLAFTIFAAPDVNRLPQTDLLIAGVTWTLAYEWLFYLSLPLISIPLLRAQVSPRVILWSGLLLSACIWIKPTVFFPWAFVIGALGAFIARNRSLVQFARHRLATFLAIAAGCLLLFAYDAVLGRFTKLAIVLVFIVPACGNTLFGLLSTRAALLLGELSYGVYLLHGLLLTLFFRFLLRIDYVAALDAATYAAIVAVVGIVLVLVSSLTFVVIERPAMSLARRIGRDMPLSFASAPTAKS